jgi:mannan endo-1,4-beta-mannosidase
MREHRTWLVAGVSTAGAAAIIIAFTAQDTTAIRDTAPTVRLDGTILRTAPCSYIGLYHRGAPETYAGVTSFTRATRVKPDIVSYYSGWLEPFQTRFAVIAARHDAVPLVQIDPKGISLRAIATQDYDSYLRSYAAAVRSYHRPVILSFGHEMNGDWYSWGYKHQSPKAFVAAWRHIVKVFRRQHADNVTWLWTVNTIGRHNSIPAPYAWWPGSSYVTWIGIDGYYAQPFNTFASLFGPTIKAVRTLARDPIPILISETGALSNASQPVKITNLFAGIRAYGLLGFVWFDVNHKKDWSVSSPAAVTAFRRGAEVYFRPVS